MGDPTQRRLDVGWGRLGALAWNEAAPTRALCLHGWMDNAASFNPLANHLADTHLVALDYAGHGQSDHRPPGANYYLHDYVFDVDAVLDTLGWDDCALIGHSLGTGVASAFAAAAPERVRCLVMLDGLGILSEPADRSAARLKRSLASVRQPAKHTRRYDSVEDAARTRQRRGDMSLASATLLAARALEAHDGQYRWRTDPGIRWESPYWGSEGAAEDLLAALECPVLAYTTPMLADYLGERLPNRLARIGDLRHHALDAGHHFHMDEPGPHADTIQAFLNDYGAPS